MHDYTIFIALRSSTVVCYYTTVDVYYIVDYLVSPSYVRVLLDDTNDVCTPFGFQVHDG